MYLYYTRNYSNGEKFRIIPGLLGRIVMKGHGPHGFHPLSSIFGHKVRVLGKVGSLFLKLLQFGWLSTYVREGKCFNSDKRNYVPGKTCAIINAFPRYFSFPFWRSYA